MKKIIAIITIVVCNAINIQGQNIVDTAKKYKEDREKLDSAADCTVIAVAEAFNVSYSKAFRQMKKFGRADKKGMKQKYFINAVEELYLDEVVTAGILEESTWSAYFAFYFAENGYTYLVMNDNHIFVIEQNENGEWVIYGNKGDFYTEIKMFIKLKINN
jgi:hypothetical protein